MEYTRIIRPPQSKALKSGRVILRPGEEVGEHITEKREELIIVIKGKAAIIKQEKEYEIGIGETFFIEKNIKHNIINKSDFELEYLFVVSLFD
jgi:quercetin dioxygenase-like cupin family protein